MPIDPAFLDRSQKLPGWCTPDRAIFQYESALKCQGEAIVLGVFGARSLLPVAKAMQDRGGGVVLAVDPMMVHFAIDGQEGEHLKYWSDQKLLDQVRREAHMALLSENLLPHVRWLEIPEASAEQAVGMFGFLELDGNHAKNLELDYTRRWFEHVHPGGFISLDDTDWESVQPSKRFLVERCETICDKVQWMGFKKRS